MYLLDESVKMDKIGLDFYQPGREDRFLCDRESVSCDSRYHFRHKRSEDQPWRRLEKFLQLVMNIPCAHSTGIERDHFLLNPGNIPLIFRDQLWFKLTIAVTGNIDLEFPVLAFECFGRVAIPLIIALKITLTIFFHSPELHPSRLPEAPAIYL